MKIAMEAGVLEASQNLSVKYCMLEIFFPAKILM